MQTQQLTDEQLIERFTSTMEQTRSATSEELNAIRRDVQLLKQRSSRPPGGAGPSDSGPLRETLGSAFMREHATQEFLRNPQPGGFKMELSRPILPSTKAASVITSPAAYVTPELRPGVILQPRRRLVLRDILNVLTMTSNTFIYIVESGPVPAGAAVQINEGDSKIQLSISTTTATAVPSTIACWVACSKQILADAIYLQQFLDERLVYEVQLAEEILFLTGTGDGTAGHPKGLLSYASAYDTARTVAGDTWLDILSHAQTQLRQLDIFPTAAILNPADAEHMRLYKSSLGTYILQPPNAVDETAALWNLTVLTTNSMPQGQFLIGDFSPASAQIVQREQAIVEISFEHADFFVTNLAALRCEERAALACYRPFAFVTGAFPAGSMATSETQKHPIVEPQHHSGKK